VLQDIITLITKNIAPEGQALQANQIYSLDMTNIIMPNMCNILAFYSIASDACPDNAIKAVVNSDTIKVEGAASSNRWKILLIVL
jgi:hypothetical protein